MPTNFRLSYTNGIEFVDLFPSTNVAAITDGDGIYQIETMDVTIPAPASGTSAPNTQTVAITTTDDMVSAPFNMYLSSTGEQATKDYATISQAQVTANQLSITRLYTMPEGSINVTLVFYIKRG